MEKGLTITTAQKIQIYVKIQNGEENLEKQKKILAMCWEAGGRAADQQCDLRARRLAQTPSGLSSLTRAVLNLASDFSWQFCRRRKNGWTCLWDFQVWLGSGSFKWWQNQIKAAARDKLLFKNRPTEFHENSLDVGIAFGGGAKNAPWSLGQNLLNYTLFDHFNSYNKSTFEDYGRCPIRKLPKSSADPKLIGAWSKNKFVV